MLPELQPRQLHGRGKGAADEFAQGEGFQHPFGHVLVGVVDVAFGEVLDGLLGDLLAALRRHLGNEKTGRMMKLPKDCIILEGGVWSGEMTSGSHFCPRAIYSYWREAWLERVEVAESRLGRARQHARTGVHGPFAHGVSHLPDRESGERAPASAQLLWRKVGRHRQGVELAV